MRADWNGAVGVFVCCLCLTGCSTLRDTGAREDPEEERVDLGYATVKKSRMTSSATTIKVDDPQERSARSVADLLRGRVAGVHVQQIGSNLVIRVRGQNSFNRNAQPLYVLDGVPLNPMSDGMVPVSVYDIDTISVLKDGAATSMYGSRGANGVIVIRTRRSGR